MGIHLQQNLSDCPDPLEPRQPRWPTHWTLPIFLAQDQWQHPRASHSSQQQKVCSSALKKTKCSRRMVYGCLCWCLSHTQLCHGRGTLTGLLIAVALVPKVAIDWFVETGVGIYFKWLQFHCNWFKWSVWSIKLGQAPATAPERCFRCLLWSV